MRRSLPIALALAAVLALVVAPLSAAKGGKHVTIQGSYGSYKFKPKTVTIKKGKTVHWSWSSDTGHNVTFDKLGGKHSKTKSSISDFKVKFKHTGTFNYMCTVHGFTGKVVVTN
jgi:plastocyanin